MVTQNLICCNTLRKVTLGIYRKIIPTERTVVDRFTSLISQHYSLEPRIHQRFATSRTNARNIPLMPREFAGGKLGKRLTFAIKKTSKRITLKIHS